MAALFLHVFVLGVLPFADAQLEAAELEHTVHVEAERDAGCTTSHNSLTCEICRTLRAPSRAPAVAALIVTPETTPEHTALSTSVIPADLSHHLRIRSRAPPQHLLIIVV
jgi:hypothetical protein